MNLEINLKVKKHYNDYLYVFYQNDKYQLPLLVTDNLKDMANMLGYSYDTLVHALYRDSIIANLYKVERVDIREPEDKFNYFEYLEYCKLNGLIPSRMTSLDKYRNQCYGLRIELC